MVVQVKLLPTAVQAAALAATLHECNTAADRVSVVAFERKVFSRNDLHKLVYPGLKAGGLGAQAAVRTIKKVVDAYTTLRANLRAGNLGRAGSKRRAKAESKPIAFRPDSAQPFDDRMLSWRHDARTVSIWTTTGRLKDIRFAGHPDQLTLLAEQRKGESDLIGRDGTWFLLATCEVREPEAFEPVDWIGVDRGIANLATTSDGMNVSGRRLSRYRRWHARKRRELQAKRTTSATRRLKRRARRETRHARQVNHKIGKEVVAVAQRTGRGIALEELGGIRDRVRLRRDQRATHTSWPFHHLGSVIAYKARRAGVPTVTVDAHYTSQTCPRCGHVARANRSSRDHFLCRRFVVEHGERGCSSTHPHPHRPWVDASRTPHPVAHGECDPA
nr:transposase [Kibdelosporangium sp. MJ126-NF4]